MTIQAEQIDQLLETLRRDCLPAGGADLISAYVSSQRQGLAQVHAELAAKPADDLAKACIERLIESGAENYLEHHFVFTIDGEDTARPATVTVQFKDRPSPHQLRLQAEEALARVETEHADDVKRYRQLLNEAGRDRYAAQKQLAEAVGLLRFTYEHAEQHRPGSLPNEQKVQAFLARHAQVEQPKAQGAQGGDEPIPHFRFEDRAGNAEWYVRLSDHRAALATQPAAPMPAEISLKLMGKIVDEVFDGGIEDCSVISDIYRVIARECRATQPAAKPMEEVDIASHVKALCAARGGLRAVSRDLEVDAGYLSRLVNGEKSCPSDEMLSKLGLRKVVSYQAVNACQIPPEGWCCSREPGHEGPCAAYDVRGAEHE